MCMDIIMVELEGLLSGVPAKFRDLPEQLISFMYKEAGENPHKAIEFISLVSNQVSQFDDKEEDKDSKSHVKTIVHAKDKQVKDDCGLDIGGAQEGASKTRGSCPGAQQMSTMEGAVNKPATEQEGTRRECNP
jgi:hypothetical protein